MSNVKKMSICYGREMKKMKLFIFCAFLGENRFAISIFQLSPTEPARPDSVSNGSLCLAGFMSVAQKDATKPR